MPLTRCNRCWMPEIRKLWWSVLDKRTTVICLEAHGQAVRMNEPFNTISGFLDGPPAHFGCRSMLDVESVFLARDLTRANVEGDRYLVVERRKSVEAIRAEKKRVGTKRYAARKAREAKSAVPRFVSDVAELTNPASVQGVKRFTLEEWKKQPVDPDSVWNASYHDDAFRKKVRQEGLLELGPKTKAAADEAIELFIEAMKHADPRVQRLIIEGFEDMSRMVMKPRVLSTTVGSQGHGLNGVYSRASKQIQIQIDISGRRVASDIAQTMVHEIAHAGDATLRPSLRWSERMRGDFSWRRMIQTEYKDVDFMWYARKDEGEAFADMAGFHVFGTASKVSEGGIDAFRYRVEHAKLNDKYLSLIDDLAPVKIEKTVAEGVLKVNADGEEYVQWWK